MRNYAPRVVTAAGTSANRSATKKCLCIDILRFVTQYSQYAQYAQYHDLWQQQQMRKTAPQAVCSTCF